MTLVKNVSVVEYTEGPYEGKRLARMGQVDSDGEQVKLNKDADGADAFQRMKWERVLVYSLPESMSKADAKEWLNDEQPEPVWDALDAWDDDSEGDDGE